MYPKKSLFFIYKIIIGSGFRLQKHGFKQTEQGIIGEEKRKIFLIFFAGQEINTLSDFIVTGTL